MNSESVIRQLQMWILKFLGDFLEKTGLLLGQQFYNHVVTKTVSDGGEAIYTLRSPGYNIWVDQIDTSVFRSNAEVVKGSANRDIITVKIKDAAVNGQLFANNPIDIFDLHNIGQNENFRGFLLPANCNLEITFTHTQQNFSGSSSVCYVILSGHKVNYGVKNG